jgi:hypothetical protein
MNNLVLSADEKSVLRFLYENRIGDIEVFLDLPPERRSVATRSLKSKGFVIAHFEEGGNVVAARITDAGVAYVDMNPRLDDPIQVEIEKLQKENLILQNKALEYEAIIREKDGVVRLWRRLSAASGIIGLLGGWLLKLMEII